MSATYRLSLKAPREQADELANLLETLAELPAFWHQPPPPVSLFQSEESDLWGVDVYFEEQPDLDLIARELETHISPRFAPLPALDLSKLEERDWVSHVQNALAPVIAGRFMIHGSHDRAMASGRACDIEINAGQAFGTAHHGTTRGCLLALDKLFKRRRYHNVLDLGTGTGLLAIAAARLQSAEVLASDIDPVSVRVARENAALNHIAPQIRFVRADGLHHAILQTAAPYDLLIANILAEPLQAMAPAIAKSVKPGGHLVLSGLLRRQSRRIEACYRHRGFKLEQRLPLDEWMTLILRKS